MLTFSKQSKKELMTLVRDFCKTEHIPRSAADPRASVEAALEGEYSFVVFDALGCDDLCLRIKDGKVNNPELEALYQNFLTRIGEGTYSFTYELAKQDKKL